MVSENVSLFFFLSSFVFAPFDRLAAPFYATCLSRCRTRLNVKKHWFLPCTIRCLLVDRTMVQDRFHCGLFQRHPPASAWTPPTHTTRQHVKKAVRGTGEGREKEERLGPRSRQLGKETREDGVTFCCLESSYSPSESFLASLEKSKVSLFLCQNAYLESNGCPSASSMDR